MSSDSTSQPARTAPAGQIPASSDAVASEAGERLRGVLDQPISTGADFIQQVARSARAIADNLEGGAPQLAQMVRQASGSAESFSHDIRDKSVQELIDVTQDFARRQPALFVGAAATAGFLLARFVKAGASLAVQQAPATTRADETARPAAPARQSEGAYHDA